MESVPIRIVLNGKQAQNEEFRQAVLAFRHMGASIEVRVTWEEGDAERFVREALRDQVPRVVAAGGDGTLNHVVNGLMGLDTQERLELGLIPLGTANDFATACKIPTDISAALALTLEPGHRVIDVAKANRRHFINVASGGFAAAATASTPEYMKKIFGPYAYLLAGVFGYFSFDAGAGRLKAEGVELEGKAVAAAVCNCRMAGGGQLLAPDAMLDDGLLDIVVLLDFPATEALDAYFEFASGKDEGRFVRRFRSSWVETWPAAPRSINLDGEPFSEGHIRFQVVPGALKMALPEGCPCVSARSTGVEGL